MLPLTLFERVWIARHVAAMNRLRWVRPVVIAVADSERVRVIVDAWDRMRDEG